MNPKTGEGGDMVPVSKNSEQDCCIAPCDCVRCVRPWFLTRITPEQNGIAKLNMGGSQFRKITPFPGKLRP